MLQYAVPNAPQTFQRSPSVFADPPSRPTNGAQQNGHNISRPSSTVNQNANGYKHSHPYNGMADNNTSGQPALAALASLAANAPAAAVNPSSTSGDSTRSSTPNNNSASMSSQQYPATAGGNPQPPTCANCQTSNTPLWRRDESGSVLCNACGLFLKLHGRPRPISLKTDVIKSRNRVKTGQPKKRDSQGGADGLATNGYPAAHPDAGLHPPVHQHGLPSGFGGDQQSQRAPSPGHSRSNTPSLSQHHTSGAPPHIFDTVTLPSDTFASPQLPASFLRQPSPAPSLNGTTSSHAEPSHNYDALIQANQALRTRVSELEVINDLFRGRVSELEASEQAASVKAKELEKRIAELEADGPRKKARTDDEHHINGASVDA